MKTITIPANVLRSFLEQIFKAAGCDDENAAITAAGVLEADLRGHRIQGTDHIYSTVTELKAGRINGHARPRVARSTTAAAQVDGDGATGHVGAWFATDLAIEMATRNGIGGVGLVRAADIFMLGAYAERIARAGLAGMVFTNSIPTRVHPVGGIDPLIGTNPVAFGLPVSDGDPVMVDFATSVSAIGHVRIASYSDATIPEGIAVDCDGEPTTNAKAALAGSLAPLGGAKGYGLGLAAALMSGPLIGAMLGEELQQTVGKPGVVPERGHLFIAIDPAAFGDPAQSRRRVRRHLDEIKRSRRARGVSEILIPGERSFRVRRETLSKGVEMLDDVWDHTLSIAKDLGVIPPLLP
jgi:LDH2 family malate/lactate/ureidoglycolate dehydrogenase